jgi:hypothetical protein
MPVARIGESVSYSDKLRGQAELINKRRQQNLNVELAQEDRNRAFREKQIADTYSFDTTGINPAFLPAISGLQTKISGHLDPKSSEVYESKEDLIKDANTLKSLYNVAKSNTEIGQASAGTYRGYLDGSVTLPDGQAFAGNKDVYDQRYRAYEKGGLDDIQIEGSAGNYTITGFELMESDLGDGSFVPSNERVNVLSSVSAIDPSYLFRPEVVKDSYLIPAEDYLRFNSVEQARSRAASEFDPKAASIQQPYRASLAEDQPDGGWLDVAENDVMDANGKVTTKKGDYLRGQSDLKESYLKEIEDFWNDNYQVDMSSSKIGSGSFQVEVNGTSVNAYQILDPKTKKPVKPEVPLPNAGSVNVSYVNASGEGDDTVLTMVYEIDGELQSETVGVSTGAARALMDQIGGEAGLVDLISRQTDLKGTSSVNESSVKEGGKGDVEGEDVGAQGTTGMDKGAEKGGDAIAIQDETVASDTVGDYLESLESMGDAGFVDSFVKTFKGENVFDFSKKLKNIPLSEHEMALNEELDRLSSPEYVEESTKGKSSTGKSRFKKRNEDQKQKIVSLLEKLRGSLNENLELKPEAVEARVSSIESSLSDNVFELKGLVSGSGGPRKIQNLKSKIESQIDEAKSLDPENTALELSYLEVLFEESREKYRKTDEAEVNKRKRLSLEFMRIGEKIENLRKPLATTTKPERLDELPKIEPKGVVNIDFEPIKDKAPKAASVIEASIDSGEAIEVSVDAPIEEKREATKQTLLGIVKPGVLESEMEETIAELISGVVGPAVKDSLFRTQRAQIEAGETTDPVPPWCAYWCADMIMRADSDFDLSSVRTKGGTEKDDPYNLGRAEKYLAIGEGVSKSDGRYDARIGDVVVKMRKTSKGSQYHVGFFAGYDENGNVLILGGNQQDSLNVTPYPYEQVQDIRRINVNAVSAEDIEAMSADINVDGKTT